MCFQKDYSGFKCECDQPKNSDKNSCVKEGFQEGVFGTNIPRGGRPVAVSFFQFEFGAIFEMPLISMIMVLTLERQLAQQNLFYFINYRTIFDIPLLRNIRGLCQRKLS